MFKSLLISILFFGSSAFAEVTPVPLQLASDAERALLCVQVNQMLKAIPADVALDFDKCLVNQKVILEVVGEGVVSVQGELEFNAPSRPSYGVYCQIYTDGAGNLIEDSAVDCE